MFLAVETSAVFTLTAGRSRQDGRYSKSSIGGVRRPAFPLVGKVSAEQREDDEWGVLPIFRFCRKAKGLLQLISGLGRFFRSAPPPTCHRSPKFALTASPPRGGQGRSAVFLFTSKAASPPEGRPPCTCLPLGGEGVGRAARGRRMGGASDFPFLPQSKGAFTAYFRLGKVFPLGSSPHLSSLTEVRADSLPTKGRPRPQCRFSVILTGISFEERLSSHHCRFSIFL